MNQIKTLERNRLVFHRIAHMQQSETLVKIIAMEIRRKKNEHEFPEHFIEKSLEKINKISFLLRSSSCAVSKEIPAIFLRFQFFSFPFKITHKCAYYVSYAFATSAKCNNERRDKSRQENCAVARENLSMSMDFCSHQVTFISFFPVHVEFTSS